MNQFSGLTNEQLAAELRRLQGIEAQMRDAQSSETALETLYERIRALEQEQQRRLSPADEEQ